MADKFHAIFTALPSAFMMACAIFLASGCASQTPNSAKEVPEYRAPASKDLQPMPAAISYAPVWRPLAAHLAKDGLSGPKVDELLAALGPVPTQSPMGRKISELYRGKFMPRPKTQTQKEKYYKGVVTEANAQLCRNYINLHKEAFMSAEKRYGVSPAIAASLLFVETRLGKVLADIPENAFYTLASMAVSTKPEDISQYLPKLTGYERHMGWLEETMHKRAAWAYNETRALVRHILQDNIPLSRLPSSIYGAVGLCQFMPSNISTYGADGDGDGKIDLFNEADAIYSLSNYLAKHGWKADLSPERKHKALMSYNHSTVYANTIMALADLVAQAGQKNSKHKTNS